MPKTSEDSSKVKDQILERFNVNESEFQKLCTTYGVINLALFGSVLTSEFKPGQSDLDFLVEMERVSFDSYFGLLERLKQLFQYENIDLITVGSLKNKVIRQEVENSKEVLYAA